MLNNMYWVTTLIFTIVLILIWFDEKNGVDMTKKGNKAFSVMIVYGIIFCVQDMFWGLCDCKIIKGDTALFFASSVFHVAIVLTSYYFMKFILAYLDKYVKRKKLLIGICFFILIAQIVLVGLNFVYPVLFRIEAGEYVTKTYRPLSFINQYIVFFVIAITTYVCTKRAEKKQKDKCKTIFWVALMPIITGVFQIAYPEAPFYSLGYFMACMMVHLFIISKERNEVSQDRILDAIANSYYTMHLFDLVDNRMEEYIESDLIAKLVNEEERKDTQKAINKVMHAFVTEEYREHVMEFVDFSTLSDRLKATNSISIDFLGTANGWTRATITSLEKDENGNQKKIMFMTQIIDEQKKREQEMFAKSQTDQLTKLLNRRAYETDIAQLGDNLSNMVYVSIDVNELKVVNDTLGHEAGDELLSGAAKCMRQCFGPYGNVYRTGGDEFAVILFANEDVLEQIKHDFEETVSKWKGALVDRLAVACGYVAMRECENESISKIANLADERMYEEKAKYYKSKGVDRRGQAAAHTALCKLYTKILKINLTTDKYSIVNMDISEQTADKGFADTISGWLSSFGKSGQVHKDDLDNYLAKTDIEFLKKYFKEGKTSINIFYRRKYDDVFKQVAMEMIPADDYSADNQTLYLYVKDIEI